MHNICSSFCFLLKTGLIKPEVFMKSNTIAAIATAMTNSGIGIIRISGEDAVEVADRIIRLKENSKRLTDCSTHTVHYGFVVEEKTVIDEVMVLLMRAPRSYTREDTVEIDCHGGILIMQKILDLVIQNGARAAEPGEFTKRAFLNGRIDLAQAESVIDIINAKNDFDNTVWYGIMPSLSLDQNSNIKLTRQRFKGNETTEKTGVNSVEALVRLLDVLKDYSVQCFFSYETGDKTTFNTMATEGIEKFEDRCSSLTGKAYSEFAIPCIPNFTIIPKEKSGVILDKRMTVNENDMAELSREKEDIMKLWIDGVYVGAAYIAAGLVAAYQCPDYLKEMFKKNVDEELPGVRFDIEAGDHPLRVHTVMAKEITGFTNSIKNEINRRSFGFVFSSENAMLGTENVHNIMVYKARNLMSDGKTYEPIYKTQVTTYIERVLRHATSDYKQENIVQFFSNNPNSQKSRWMEKKNCVNAVLGAGDDVEYEIDEANGYCTLNITFNGNVKNLEVEINRFNSSNRAI
jgi:hypothetical protein